MASLSDILTASQNIVVALNNVVVQLSGLLSASNPVQLYEGQLPTSVAVLYTASSETASAITAVNAVNTTGGALTCRLYIVPKGGTAGATNAIVYDKSLVSADFVIWLLGQVIPAGATLQGYASGAGITLAVTGRTGL